MHLYIETIYTAFYELSLISITPNSKQNKSSIKYNWRVLQLILTIKLIIQSVRFKRNTLTHRQFNISEIARFRVHLGKEWICETILLYFHCHLFLSIRHFNQKFYGFFFISTKLRNDWQWICPPRKVFLLFLWNQFLASSIWYAKFCQNTNFNEKYL